MVSVGRGTIDQTDVHTYSTIPPQPGPYAGHLHDEVHTEGMLQPPHPLDISLYGKYGNFNTLQNWNGSLNYKIMTKYCTTGSVNTAPYKYCTTVLVIQECTNVVQLIIIQQHTNIAQLALSYSNTQLLEMLYTWP